MSILIWKENQQRGPFTETQILEHLRSGDFSSHDLAWTPGYNQWKPLSEILHIDSAPPILPPPRIKPTKAVSEACENVAPSKSFWKVLLEKVVTTARLAKIQAYRKKLEWLDLRRADHRIGRKAYDGGNWLPGHENLTARLIDLNISVIELKDVNKSKPANFAERAKAALKSMARSVKIQALKLKQKRLITELGTELRQALHVEVPLAAEIAAAELVLNRVKALDSEIEKLECKTYWWARRPLWIIATLSTAGAAWIGVAVFASLSNQGTVGSRAYAEMQKKALAFLGRKDREATQQLEELEKERQQLLQEQARLATGQPQWPIPIQKFSSPDQWAQAYKDAKPITASEFLARTPSVRLAVLRNPGIQKYFSDQEWLDLVQRNVEANGIKIRSDARVKLVVEASLDQRSLDYTVDSEVENSFPVGLALVKLKFVVTAPVLRFGRFQNLEVAPASQWSCELLRGSIDKNYLESTYQSTITNVITGFRKPGDPDKDKEAGERAWLASQWDKKENPQMYQDYLAAGRTGGVELERCFSNFPRISDYWFIPDETASEALNMGAYKAQWIQCLNESRPSESQAGYIIFQHELRSIRQGASVAAEKLFGFEGSPYHSNISAVRIYEYNVVYAVNNDPADLETEKSVLVRGKVLIFDHVDGDMCVPRNFGSNVRQLNEISMNEVTQQMRYRH